MSLKVLVARPSSNNNMASASPWWWDIYLRILPWSGLGHKTLQQQQQKPQLGVMMNLPESPKVLVTESFHNNRSLSWWWWCIHLSLQRSWPQNPSTTEASVHGVMHLPVETPESLPCSPGLCHKTPQQQSVACKWGIYESVWLYFLLHIIHIIHTLCIPLAVHKLLFLVMHQSEMH